MCAYARAKTEIMPLGEHRFPEHDYELTAYKTRKTPYFHFFDYGT